MKDHPSGWTEAVIINPWDTTTLLQRVAMVPGDMTELPPDLPSDAVVVRIPLEKAVVESTVHVGLIEEFGGDEAIAGVSDVDYIKSPAIREKLRNGQMVNCGGWMSPDIERIIKLSPDAILISPYQNGGSYGHLTDLQIPVLYFADYTEKNPLGRAEWIRYYGRLFGRDNKADSIFNAVAYNYNYYKEESLKDAELNGRKSVIMDIPAMGTWYVPPGGTTNSNFIEDAGAANPFQYLKGDQFVGIAAEKALFEASDADVWIIRLNSASPLTMDQLKKDFSSAPQFKAYKEGNVWACNTNDSFYFEETPFHPEKLMEDLYHILHTPNPSDSLNYFNRLK